jgi:NADH-quinone oxidoreductase subunit I
VPAKFVIKKVPKYGVLGAISKNASALLLGVKYFFEPNRFTLMYPREYIVLDKRYRGFIVLIKNKCIGCDSCARVCPTGAMKMVRFEVPDPKNPKKKKIVKYPTINHQRCVYCGFCVDICPTEALYHVPVHDIVYFNLEDMIQDVESFQKEGRLFWKIKEKDELEEEFKYV